MWYLHRKGGGRQSPERHRAIKNRAIRDAQTTKCSSFRDAHTHSLRRKGGAASPVLDPIAPGGTSSAEPTPSGKAPSVARGAVRANRSRTRDPNTHAQRGTKRADKNFPFAFQKKVSTSVATKDDRRDSPLAAPGNFLTAAKLIICLRLPSSLSLNTFPNALTRVELSRRISGEVEVWQHTNTCDHANSPRFLSSVG